MFLAHASSLLEIVSSDNDKTEAASKAELIAPGLPIASVPTGIPAGI